SNLPVGEHPLLFTRLKLRGVTLRNRIVVSPMCMYSARADGEATDFHLAHLVRFALGGAGAVIAEATAVSAEGRISYNDLGLFDDRQMPGLRRVASALRAEGAVPGIQLNHSGRRGSGQAPWRSLAPLDADHAASGLPP